MEFYLPVKHVHMLAAYLTTFLFVLRLALDAIGRTGWRTTPLRFIPHINDTVLLLAAITLVSISGWMPFVHHWLTLKIFLLIGYIVAGIFALRLNARPFVRIIAAFLALAQLAVIFHLAVSKPLL